MVAVMPLGFFVLDPTYVLFVMIPALLLSLWAQAKVKSAYHRASQIAASSGVTGAAAARAILDRNGLYDVRIESVKGWLSDHYDPQHRVLRLSPAVYGTNSLAALGIAAHEAGHALQQAKRYAPLSVRNAIVPLASIGSSFSFVLIIIGLLFASTQLLWAGVIFFGLTVLFQVVNLPVEFDASRRARAELAEMRLVADGGEAVAVRKVLSAAALTYVAAAVTGLLNLLYFVLLAAGSQR